MEEFKKFENEAVTTQHSMWNELNQRLNHNPMNENDVRSEFARDYTRILHSMAYRRLKHKTQVFYNIGNDHICTRMEHVAHVESVSGTIAKSLGLNTELTKAIAIGHDLGHAPFGHQGERILNKISLQFLSKTFWHERNGLRFVDNIELLPNSYNNYKNLNLTYAVRDGIISHCGEVDENGIKPRNKLIVLEDEFNNAGMYQPATWEGCVVKLSDKIAYVGRDIEDAIQLGFLSQADINTLNEIKAPNDHRTINTTIIMHDLIYDVCVNSSPEKGICLTEKSLKQLNQIKKFNYEKIYSNPRFDAFIKYSELVLTQLFEKLYSTYSPTDSWKNIEKFKLYYPNLMNFFEKWLAKYCDINIIPSEKIRSEYINYSNTKIYGSLESEQIYIQAIIDFLSGMTDRFAVDSFNELISY